MLCERLLGSLRDGAVCARLADELGSYDEETVDLTWDEARKRILRKTGSRGTEVGIRLGEADRRRGIRTGDVLGVDAEEHLVLVARIEPADALVLSVDPSDANAAARVAWEIGNTHAPLFACAEHGNFATPFSEPLLKLFEGVRGVRAVRAEAVLDPGRMLSSGSGHGHGHAHGHGHGHAQGAGGPAPAAPRGDGRVPGGAGAGAPAGAHVDSGAAA